MIKRLRAMRMGLETVLGLRRQGFFIPYRYAPSVPKIIPVYDEFGTFMRGLMGVDAVQHGRQRRFMPAHKCAEFVINRDDLGH
jgi:hypothetical protein